MLRDHEGRLVPVYEQFGESAVAVEHHNRKWEELAKRLHCTAEEKEILACTNANDCTEIIDEVGLPSKTPQTFTDRDTLFGELELIRERCYAVADEEQLKFIHAVGESIHGSDGSARGAVAASVPTSRLKHECFKSPYSKQSHYEKLDLSKEVL
ncbi:IclR family transcriptional regulator C-terminal domain-containing protein [Natronomonas sp.]|uniref:IclR family transcriptional regulator domain-containing protein n=1 Tax=Natronomonas sp. TaxID=2184060 RepID=UPI0037C84630